MCIIGVRKQWFSPVVTHPFLTSENTSFVALVSVLLTTSVLLILVISQRVTYTVAKNLIDNLSNDNASSITLAVKDLRFSYPDQSTDSLRDISFTVPAGSCVLVTGSNGSGKTTFLSAIAGISSRSFGRQYQRQCICEWPRLPKTMYRVRASRSTVSVG